MKKVSVWMALVTDEGEVVFARVCKAKRKSKKSIVDYLRKNEAFESKSFADACSWISEKDLRLNLMVFKLDAKDFDGIDLLIKKRSVKKVR